MDWAAEGNGNRNPIIVLNGNEGNDLVHIEKKQGASIVLVDASKTFVPENDPLTFKWWVMPEAGTYKGKVTIKNDNPDRIKFVIPSDSAGKTIHIICEVTDKGEPILTSYSRIIITSKK